MVGRGLGHRGEPARRSGRARRLPDHFGIDRIEELGERLDPVASFGDHTFTVATTEAA
jgi:hypothetical protein